ncbi:mucin-associated surface protein (MASP), putative [Trypanosoma cruzi marinkellei]|uniref:Mucin-associated surface protein (MASP), putative n=1 Tax=Trypanosoma cruzi marinkellei TaxID=85056 RepID=K2MQK0_TRYCR|nr:mucin-associated surface protein (MASP), putative [Trypanosoma cruzi marinkellei]
MVFVVLLPFVTVRWMCDLSLSLLFSLCIDGELVCAEGYTQVTGVMAMMMTGRVLLVCALCVLWCGIAGGRCDETTAGSGSGGGGTPTKSEQIETPPQGPQGLNGESPSVKENVAPPSSTSIDEESEDEDDDDEDDDDDTGDEENVEGQGDQEGKVAVGSGSTEKNLSGSGQHTGQSIVSSGGIPPSGTHKPNDNLTQKETEGKKETDENTPAVENSLTTANGENTLPAGIAGGTAPPPSEDGVDSRERDGEDTTTEGNKNVSSPETAATPHSHRSKGTEGTEEDAKATTVTANTTDTTNTQNSDGSTAVSHITSPLLLLLVVASAAAAAVVAA